MTAARVLLIDEGVLGHRTFAAQLRDGLAAYSGEAPTVATVPAPNRAELALLRRPALLGRADLFELRWRLRWSWQARWLFDRVDADVALINTQASALLCEGPMSRVPTVLSFDATVGQFMRLEYGGRRSWLSPTEERTIRRLEQRAITASACVLIWTHWAAAGLRDEYDLEGVRVETIHPGLDADWWGAAASEREPAREGPIRLLFVGNDVERKGLGVLIEALASLGDGFRLDVVSTDEFDAPPGVQIHRGLAAGTPELRAIYAQADVFAFPTRADVVPWTILEAMASGLPVVATEVGAIAEVIGDAGVTIPPQEPAALAAAIASLSDPAERRRLGERGMERVRLHYDRAVQMPRLGRLLDDLAETSR